MHLADYIAIGILLACAIFAPWTIGRDKQVALRLRDAGVAGEIATLLPAETDVLRRDRSIVILALALLITLAWGYLLWLSAHMDMSGMDMSGMDMSGFRIVPSGMGDIVPSHMPWAVTEFAFVFVMWTVMMVGMMTPSTAPMLLMYARVGRQTDAKGRPLAATIWFAIGYFYVWVAFALLATLVQWALERSALLDFTMASTSHMVGAIIFVAAGLYQWTRLNDFCITQCQRPFEFLMQHCGYRRDALGSVMLGLRHGAYCVGCCWTLMALLLVGGVMNVLWIALLALFALLERVTSMGRLIARVAGIVLIAGGVWLFSMGMS